MGDMGGADAADKQRAPRRNKPRHQVAFDEAEGDPMKYRRRLNHSSGRASTKIKKKG